jgi:hypothetical protein
VVSDLDIYRAANLLIDRYGADALIAAARMIDRILELGAPRRTGRAAPHPARGRGVAGAAERGMH